MLWKSLLPKITALLVFFLWLVRSLKNFKIIVHHLEKCGLFSDFWYRFRSSRSTADLLTVVSDRIARAFDRVWYAGLLHKLKSYGISGHTFGLIFSFLNYKWLWVALDGMSSQEYPVNAGVPQGSILGTTLLLIYISDLSDDVIWNIAICVDDMYVWSSIWSMAAARICCWTYIHETLWTGAGSSLLISMLEKLNWFCLTSLITLMLWIRKRLGLFWRKNRILRPWGWLSLLNWMRTLTLFLLLKLPSRKLGSSFY